MNFLRSLFRGSADPEELKMASTFVKSTIADNKACNDHCSMHGLCQSQHEGLQQRSQ